MRPPGVAPSVARAGFTLIEVLVALALTGIVALLAHRLLAATVDGVRALGAERLAQDRRANGRRWLRAAFLSLEPDAPGGFEGGESRLRWTGWLEQPGGWFEPVRLTLSVRDSALVAELAGEETLVLGDSAGALAIDYLLTPGAESRWVREWHSPLSAPLAVRLRILALDGTRVDTLFFLIGERG